MRAQGLQKAELAQRLHWHKAQIDRLFDLGQTALFEHIEQAAASLSVLSCILFNRTVILKHHNRY
jgi:hypothetical protein